MMYERCNTEECDAGCSGPRDVLFLIHQTTYMGSMFDDIAKFYSLGFEFRMTIISNIVHEYEIIIS